MKKVCRLMSRLGAVLMAFYLLAGVAFSSSPSFTFVNADTGTGSRLYFNDIKPGETVYGSFQISLLEDVPALFEIMFNDKASFKLKKLAYDEVKEDSFFFSKWFKYDVSSPVFVDGLGSVDIPFSIHVPDDAIPGDYSGLFVSALKTYGPEALKANEIITSGVEEESSITGARINVGVAIEVLLRVAGEIFPSVEFVDVGYYKDKGSDKFVLDLFYKNTGNVAVVPRANVKILDVWGTELYSGTFRFSVLNALMDGNSKIKINSKDFELTSGIYSLKVDLFYDVFSRDLGENLVYVSGTAEMKIFYFEWYYFVLIGLVFLPVLFFFFYKNIRLYFLMKNSKDYIVKKNETLQMISNKYKVNAEKLILLNKLKSPYFLNEGDVLLIPLNPKKK